MKIKTFLFITAIAPLVAFCGGKDIDGNDLTRASKLGYVDGELTTVGNVADFASPPSGYYNVSNTAYTALQPSDIVNVTVSTATNKALSANMGHELQDQINNLKARGRYLSIWDCSTGLARTNPTVSPYLYKAGDYFIVGNVSTNVNYRPYGTNYVIGVASTNIEESVIVVNDTYYYDGSAWSLLHTDIKEVSFANIAGDPDDNIALSNRFADVGISLSNSIPAVVTNVFPIVTNSYTKGEVDSAIAQAAPLDYANVSNAAMRASSTLDYSWSYPNCWYISVTMSNRVDVTTTPTDTIVGFMVFSNDVQTTVSGTDARCRAVLCDDSSIETPSIRNWASLTTGGSITSNGVFSADADGLYRVSAEDAVGKIRYVDIPIQSDVTTYATNTYYAADVAGTVRASVNGAALTLLQNATVVSTNWYEGTEYKVYSSFTPRMSAVGTGAGNVKCWAVSQHILSSAKHYTVKQLGANTFSDGVNSATVYRQEWVSLSDWAATNGFTAAEIAEAGIDDICLIRCSKSSSVPDGCIPYFMRSDKIESWFGGTLAGVQAWMSVQDHTEAIPTTYKWEGDYTLKDVKAQYCRMGTLYPVHSGDSGRCIFMMKNGNPVMLRQFGTAYEGPSFVNGFKIIKAFVENYGDTLKEAN